MIGLAVAGFALAPLATGVTGVCPLYLPFGASTLRGEQGAAGQQAAGEGREVPVKEEERRTAEGEGHRPAVSG